ncbi:hypothetical protein KUA55_05685 [Enterococcus sp. ALS3]|uniref:Uncharacterized protein n=2 Tax=Enterococcus alishanensis TaxID=1303817 RepID=A0ABS6TB87_9ENTE|nr:hypothetical protein [Enterococcus alishanensis]
MMTTPQLTAMPRPAYDLGFQACEVLKGEISNDNYKKKATDLINQMLSSYFLVYKFEFVIVNSDNIAIFGTAFSQSFINAH